jgi:predicted RNase H-like HicB family nuclease
MENSFKRYLVIYERSKDGYSAYVPDLPGCTSAGATKEEIEENIVEAIKFHLEVMEDEGYKTPPATSYSEMLVIA